MEDSVEPLRLEGQLLGVSFHPGHIAGQSAGELEESLGAVAADDAGSCHSCDLAREPARAAADVEHAELLRDPGGLDQQRDPEAQVVLGEAGIKMLGRKPLGAKREPVDAQ
jgi:hypothetical protein